MKDATAVKKFLGRDEDDSTLINSDWPDPIEISKKEELPEFNTDIFPGWVKKFVEQVSVETQTPISFSAITVLAVISIATLKKFNIHVKGTWEEHLSLYTTVVAESSSRKSAVYKLLFDPLIEFENNEISAIDEAKSQDKVELNELNLKKKYLENKYSEKGEDYLLEDLKKITYEIENFKYAQEERLIASDATPEKLIEIMANNNEKIGLASAEGDVVFKMMAGQYSDDNKFNLYLQSYSGETYEYDRKTSESLRLESPSMAIALFVQPIVIKGLSNKFDHRGAASRFLYAFPESNVGYRDSDPDIIEQDVMQSYKHNIKKLLELEKDQGAFGFDKEGIEFINQMGSENELEFRSDELTAGMKAWKGKLIGKIIRISAILHLMHSIESEYIDRTISLEFLEKAYSLYNFFVQHAAKTLGNINSKTNQQEEIEYVLNRVLSFGKKSIEYREIQQNTKNKVSTKRLKEILEELQELHYITQYNWRKKRLIEINPKLFT